MKCSLAISNFLKRSLVFPILLFSSISLHWSLRKAFLYLLAILWNSAFKWVYLSFSPLLLTSLLFPAICKAASDSHFAFFAFLFLGDGFDPCLQYNVTNLQPYFFRHSVYQSLFFYWSVITSQCCVSFCCTMNWISYMYTYTPEKAMAPHSSTLA